MEIVYLEGSPPRVRGIGYTSNDKFKESGITPACAGNRGGQRGDGWVSQDHPRVCGE